MCCWTSFQSSSEDIRASMTMTPSPSPSRKQFFFKIFFSLHELSTPHHAFHTRNNLICFYIYLYCFCIYFSSLVVFSPCNKEYIYIFFGLGSRDCFSILFDESPVESPVVNVLLYFQSPSEDIRMSMMTIPSPSMKQVFDVVDRTSRPARAAQTMYGCFRPL